MSNNEEDYDEEIAKAEAKVAAARQALLDAGVSEEELLKIDQAIGNMLSAVADEDWQEEEFTQETDDS